jgi:hypothetical protein
MRANVRSVAMKCATMAATNPGDVANRLLGFVSEKL